MQDILEQPITTRRVIIICAVLFAVMALLSFGASGTSFFPKFAQNSSEGNNSIRLSDADTKAAINANIMGKVPEVVVDAVVEEKPKTVAEPKPPKPQKKPLEIKVLGLIASNNRQFSYAILQEGGRKQKSYAIGEALDDGETTVKDIEAERVVFDRDGDEEIAYLHKPTNQTGTRAQTNIPSQEDPFGILEEFNNDQSSIQYTPPENEQTPPELFDNPEGFSASERAAELMLSGAIDDLPEELQQELQNEAERYNTSLMNNEIRSNNQLTPNQNNNLEGESPFNNQNIGGLVPIQDSEGSYFDDDANDINSNFR